jgi:DNA segregation ATPase FtsK/SpoIIIE, S-DNA-T family
MPSGPLVVAPPPVAPPPRPAGPSAWLRYLLPAAGVGGVAALALAQPPSGVAGAGLLVAAAALLAGVWLAARQRSTERHRRLGDRLRYLDHLDEVRRAARETAEQQAAVAQWRHPPATALWQLIDVGDRLWERRPGDPDFLAVRVGIGRVPLARPLVRETAPGGGAAGVDPISEEAARRLIESSQAIDEQPLVVDLAATPSVAVIGPPEQAWSLARAIVAQIVAWHAPSEVRAAFVLSSETAALWTWVKWLPHVEHPRAWDAEGPARLFATDADELVAMLGAELRVRARRAPHAALGAGGRLVLIVDRGVDGPLHGPPELAAALADPGPFGLSVLHIRTDPADEAPGADVRLRVDKTEVVAEGDAVLTARGVPELLSRGEAEVLGRRLAALRLDEEPADDVLAAPADVLGFEPEQLDTSLTWKPRSAGDLLRVPIGASPDGALVHLDLKDAALGGAGPHGVCVGPPGSGKSEFLRAVVVALAATHPPEQLAVLLVDASRGETFAELADLPHAAGPVIDLANGRALVDRLRDALIGELQRRQEVLRAAGRAAMRDYAVARAVDANLPPLPHLLVAIDEIGGLVEGRPDFADVLVALGRLGSSLGINLLLAARRFDEERDERLLRLAAHLSYRVTFGQPDAAAPLAPGAGYLRPGDGAPQRFRVTHVSGPPRPPVPAADTPRVAAPGGPEMLPFTASAMRLPTNPAPTFAARDENLPSTTRLVVDQIRDQTWARRDRRTRQVWLPPLDRPPTLDQLVSAPAVDPDRGLVWPDWPDQGRLRAPIGLVDKPVQQQQDVFAVDLTGNFVVVGGPQSGKTGLLRTLLAATALTHTPDEIQFYCADLGGGGLARLRDFPHVAAVASARAPEEVRRLVTTVAELLTARVERFRKLSIASASAMRELRAAGRLADEPHGDVVLVVDGWTTLRREFADLEPVIAGIATRGPAHAVHVALAANRWAHLRPPARGSFGARLELRLSDPGESAVGRGEAANVPEDRPGRGLTQESLHVQVALARTDGVASADGLNEALSGLARASKAAWPGASATEPGAQPPGERAN